MILQGTLVRALVIVLVALGLYYGVSKAIQTYGRAEVQEARASQGEAVLKAVQSAAVANTISDAAQTQGRAVLVAPVRAAITKVRESLVETPEAPAKASDAGTVGAEYLRLLNDAIRASNAGIRTAQGLP